MLPAVVWWVCVWVCGCGWADAKWSGHKADPSRAQEDLTSGFGVDDRGVPREWNDEYQCVLELPNDTPELVRT